MVANVLLSALTGSVLQGTPFPVDIHLPVRAAAHDAALRANAFLNSELHESAVDFAVKDTPHVTLYLTSWTCPEPLPPPEPGTRAPPPTCLQRIQLAIADILGSFGPACPVTLSEPFAAGTYAMMRVARTDCLQRYSDAVVNATYTLSQPHQPVPSWVNSLPEPQRSRKIALVKEFGSPNVFDGFEPHVTLAWSNDTAAVAAAVDALRNRWRTSTFVADVLALGMVGPHGTVLRGRNLGVYNVTAPDTGLVCEQAHSTAAACDADNVTDGGCVWCHIAGQPPRCTSHYKARRMPPPPPGQPRECEWGMEWGAAARA